MLQRLNFHLKSASLLEFINVFQFLFLLLLLLGQLCLIEPEILDLICRLWSTLSEHVFTAWKTWTELRKTSLAEVCFVYTVTFMKYNVVNISHVNHKALTWRVWVFFILNKRAGPCSQRWNVSWEMVSLGRSYSISIQIFIFFVTSTKTNIN